MCQIIMTVESCVKCLPWLKKLTKARTKIARKKFFRAAPLKVLRSIREIIKNILNGKIKIKDSQKHFLKRYKNVLYRVTSNDYPVTKQKTILVQRGGFLPNLLLPIISILSSTIADKILK